MQTDAAEAWSTYPAILRACGRHLHKRTVMFVHGDRDNFQAYDLVGGP